jgi:hypothetical protein
VVQPASTPAAAAENPNLSREDALRDKEVALLRKLALTKSAGGRSLRFWSPQWPFTSFVTTIISARTL